MAARREQAQYAAPEERRRRGLGRRQDRQALEVARRGHRDGCADARQGVDPDDVRAAAARAVVVDGPEVCAVGRETGVGLERHAWCAADGRRGTRRQIDQVERVVEVGRDRAPEPVERPVQEREPVDVGDAERADERGGAGREVDAVELFGALVVRDVRATRLVDGESGAVQRARGKEWSDDREQAGRRVDLDDVVEEVVHAVQGACARVECEPLDIADDVGAVRPGSGYNAVWIRGLGPLG